MQINSSNKSKGKTFSNSLNLEKDQIICKDGFCSLPEIKENPKVEQNKTNIFDPI